MKKYYITFALILSILFCSAQDGYEFGIVHNTGYNFKVVAIPNFTSSGNTDISDIGFALYMPAGSVDIENQIGLLGGRAWDIIETTEAVLTSNGLGDGTKDVFLLQLPIGQTLLSHTLGEQIDLVSFDVTNTPTSGEIAFMLNSDPINVAVSGAMDSFYNSNIDETTTQNYFLQLHSGMESFMFSTLGIEESKLLEQKILVYPNPASKLVHVRSPLVLQKLELYDVLGEKVFESDKTSQIDVSKFSTGIYFLNVYVENGKAIKKIIVE